MKHIFKSILSLALCFSLLVPFACALSPQERREDLDMLYASLQQLHPDIYYAHSKADFEAFKREIEAQLDTLSDTDFMLALAEFTALLGDSHTSLDYSSIAGNFHIYPVGIQIYDGRWTISVLPEAEKEHLGAYIETIAGHTPDEIMAAMARILGSDNAVKLSLTTRQMVSYHEILAYLGLVEEMETITLEVTGTNGQPAAFALAPLTAQQLSEAGLVSISSLQTAQMLTAVHSGTYYTAFPLDESTFYIQYNTCAEDPSLPMVQFAEAVESSLKEAAYEKILLDLRYNSGGSDGVLIPLLNTLAAYTRQNDCMLIGLIGESTYSSAIINAVMVEEAGGILAGSTASGNVNHFGDLNLFTLPNSETNVYYSTKLISLADYFTAVTDSSFSPLVPSIQVSQTRDDFIAGIDTLVAHLMENTPEPVSPARNKPISRGPALEMLYALSGSKQAVPGDAMFQDVFYEFASYTPAIAWAAEAGIANGTADQMFSPLRAITREEFAVFLHRYVQEYLPETAVPSIYYIFADETEISDWAKQAAQVCVAAGWIDAPNGVFAPQAVVTYGEAAEAVAKLQALS